MNFWEEHYSPTNDPTINQQPKPLVNITPLPDGRFRAYKTVNNKKLYLGTFNTQAEAIDAQINYTLSGSLPEKKRKKRHRVTLSELVDNFLEQNGLPENE